MGTLVLHVYILYLRGSVRNRIEQSTVKAFEVHIMEVSSFRGLQKMGRHFVHSQLHCLSSYTLPAASTRWVGRKFTHMVCNYRR